MSYPNTRLRRLRYNKTLREMVEDVHLRVEDFIYPVFVCDGSNIKREVSSMPGQHQFSIDKLPELFKQIISKGIKSVLLFGVPISKDE